MLLEVRRGLLARSGERRERARVLRGADIGRRAARRGARRGLRVRARGGADRNTAQTTRA